MEERARALFVSDYQKLGELTRTIARQRGDIDVDVEYDVMENGVLNLERLASEEFLYKYDVFIARGECAQRLRQEYSLPVVDIPVSAYDVLKTLKLAQTYGGKAAIVNNSVVSGDVALACELMGYPIDSYGIETAADAVELLERLQKENYTLIVGGHLIVSIARRFHMNGVVIASGETSINDALNRAVGTAAQMRGLRRERLVQKHLLDCTAKDWLAFDGNGRVLYAGMQRTPGRYAEAVSLAKPLVGEALYGSTAEMTFSRRTEAGLWILRAKRVTDEGAPFVLFQIDMAETDGQTLDGVVTIGDSARTAEEPMEFNPFSGVSLCAQELRRKVELYAKSDSSVLITGGWGSGKRNLAELLHNGSRYRNELVCTLHCDLLLEEELDYLFLDPGSPFAAVRKCTLILDQVDTLDISAQTKLYRGLQSSAKYRRYRLLALSSRDLFSMVNAGSFHYKLYRKISELSLAVPPLEERKEDIEGMCGILIGMFNEEMGAGITGIDKKGLRLLREFPWGDDMDRFESVVRRLVRCSEGPVVRSGTVREVLAEEASAPPGGRETGGLSLEGSYEEIMERVIRAVVEEEGSETRAARRLGISRTTIWRRLSHSSATDS